MLILDLCLESKYKTSHTFLNLLSFFWFSVLKSLSLFRRWRGNKEYSRTLHMMAAEENQTQLDAVLAQLASSPSSGSRPNRDARKAKDIQDARRLSDQSWNFKQRSSPSLLLYRKLSCDSGKDTVLDKEYKILDYGSELLCKEEKLDAEQPSGMRTKETTPSPPLIPGKGLEGSLCQLDDSAEGGDSGSKRAGSTNCSCNTSGLKRSPIIYSNNSPKSSPSPNSSPVHSPHQRPKRRHIRRSSMPVSMLAFTKVKQTVIDSHNWKVSDFFHIKWLHHLLYSFVIFNLINFSNISFSKTLLSWLYFAVFFPFW